MRRSGRIPAAALVLLLGTGCAARHAAPAPRPGDSSPRLDLPSALEAERRVLETEISEALDEVKECFRSAGLDWPEGKTIDSVVIFETSPGARQALAAEYGLSLESIPETFSGTVVEDRLYLVSRSAYEAIWRKLYPTWPWSAGAYRGLIVHELTHKAHESWAMARYGTADAMGPPWLFEGFAVVCAGQFLSKETLLSSVELRGLLGAGRAPEVSYPLYGRIVRSLAALHGTNEVMTGAAQSGFPDSLLDAEEGP